jgi:HK97 gp10 family phage protein
MASKVKGLDRLLRQLQALPNSVRAELSDALLAEAREMAAAVARATPRRYGDLQASVGWSAGAPPRVRTNGAFRLSPEDFGARGDALAKAGLLFTVYAGDDKAYYARFVEFGTSPAPKGRSRDITGKSRNNLRAHAGTKAQPFFYPTIRARKKAAKSRVVRRLNKAVKAVAALR